MANRKPDKSPKTVETLVEPTPTPEATVEVDASILALIEEVKAEDAKAKAKTAKAAETAAKEEAVNALLERHRAMIGSDELFAKLKAKLLPGKAKSGIMDRKFYDRYSAQGGNNGDKLAVALREKFVYTDALGAEHFEREAFTLWAKQQGFHQPRYDSLNAGHLRMNVGNRARAAIRNGRSVTLDGVEYGRADIRPVK
jgi:hypothetical protein